MHDVYIRQKDAAKKMSQIPNGELKRQSGSRVADQILSGWQGSDEDEDVNIDSSDEEVVLSSPKRSSKCSPSSPVQTGAAEETPRKDTKLTPNVRDPSSLPENKSSGSAFGDLSEMKVRSADARRFRKEFVVKSGARPAVIPQASSASLSTNGAPVSAKKDGRTDQVEDIEEGEIEPEESRKVRNDSHSLSECNNKAVVGTTVKRDQGEIKSVGESRKRKDKEFAEPSETDEEVRKRRRYRELEEAQRIADRRQTLRERPDPRLLNGKTRREAEAPNDSVERVQRMFSEKGTRHPEKLTTKDSSSKPSEGIHESPSSRFGQRKRSPLLSGTRTGEKAKYSLVSAEEDKAKPAQPPITSGNGSSVVLESKKRSPIKSDVHSTEVLVKGKGTALPQSVNHLHPTELPSERAARKQDGRISTIKGGNGVEESSEADLPAASEVGTVRKASEKETSRQIISDDLIKKGASASEERCSPSEIQVSGGTVQGRGTRCRDVLGGYAVDNSECAIRITVTDGPLDANKTQPANDCPAKSEPGTLSSRVEQNCPIQPTNDSPAKPKTDTVSSGVEKKLDSSTGGKEAVATCLPEAAGNTTLNNGIHRPMAAGEILQDQTPDAVITCDLTVDDTVDRCEEASEVDDHNSFCEACLQGGMLLCCDATGCKVTYHLECYDPSMTEVPEGKWYCPSCAQKRLSFGVNASHQAVESIWDVRDCICPSCSCSKDNSSKSNSRKSHGVVEKSGRPARVPHLPLDGRRSPQGAEDSSRSSSGTLQQATRRKQVEDEVPRDTEKRKSDAAPSSFSVISPSAEDQSKRCDKQYFVKWKQLSHLHNSWVSESELKKAAPKLLDSFKKRLESESVSQGRTKWKASWQVPERFLTKKLNGPPRRPGGGRGRGYLGMDARLEWLVKWQDLGYEHCTWESVHAGLLDSEVAKTLESNYERWCEDAKRRSLPAHIEEVMKLRDAKFKSLDEPSDWLQSCNLSEQQMDWLNILRERWHLHRNSLLVDEIDQERTTTAVAFLLSLIEEYGAYKPILVIVPATGLQMWKSELDRCAEHVNTVVYVGNPTGRSILQRYELNPSEKPVKVQISLTTFEIANSDHEHLRKFEWEALVIDEGNRARLTKPYRQLQFRAPYRLILLSDFSKCTQVELQQFSVFLEPENTTLESELQKQLEGLDEDTQLEFLRGKLSEKMVGDGGLFPSTPLEFAEHWIAGSMTPVQVHLYCTELIKHFNMLHSGRTRADQSTGSIYELTGTLRNVCNHPFLVDSTLQEDLLSILKPPQTLVEAGICQCGKFKTLLRMLTYLHAKSRRVLLVCQTDVLCYYLDDYMRVIFGPDSYECVSKVSEAAQAIQRFNADDSARFVFILKRNTAGVFFQLRETDAVIVYDSDWNPANDLQYLGKIINKVPGQLNVYRLYTPLSVEEAAITYYSERRTDLLSGMKVWTAKYCQQIIKWKVKKLFELNDVHSRGASEKDLMAKVLGHSSDGTLENLTKRILDGEAEAGTEKFDGEVPEEEVEALKEFWGSLLRERYAALQMEEQMNARKGLRNRKRVHYGEDALALASYVAASNEEVKKKRRRTQCSESAQRGGSTVSPSPPSPKSSPVAIVKTCSSEESIPAKSISKDTNIPDVALQAAGKEEVKEEVSAAPSGKATKGIEPTLGEGNGRESQREENVLPAASKKEGNERESQREEMVRPAASKKEGNERESQREENVHPAASKKVTVKTTSGLSSASHEDARKLRSEQQQCLLGLWRPDVARICRILELSEKALTYADHLLEHCMKNYRMPKGPKDLVLQVQLALCVVAAERFHQETDHSAALSKVELFMEVKLKKECWNENYQKFLNCCKGYPLPELPNADHISPAQKVVVASDVAGKAKSTDEDVTLHKPEPSAALLDNTQAPPAVGKPTSRQTTEPREEVIKNGQAEANGEERVQQLGTAVASNQVDERRAAGKEQEFRTAVERPDMSVEREQKLKPADGTRFVRQGQEQVTTDERQDTRKEQDVVTQGLNVPLAVVSEVNGVSGVKESETQVTFDVPVTDKDLQNPPSTSGREQVLEKLKLERYEINKVVVHQQAKELNEFYHSNSVEKGGILKRNQETTAKLESYVKDPVQRANLLHREVTAHKENLKKFELQTKEKHEALVKRQRAIRDQIHSLFTDLLRQASSGSTRSLYDEAEAILANMGVKSVAEAQSIYRAVEDEARRKKAPVTPATAPQSAVRQARGQVSRTPADPQPGNILESTRGTQQVSQPQSASAAGTQSRAQSSHIQHTSQVVAPQPSLPSGTPRAQPQTPQPGSIPPSTRSSTPPAQPQTSSLVYAQPSLRSEASPAQPEVSQLVPPQSAVRSGTPPAQPPPLSQPFPSQVQQAAPPPSSSLQPNQSTTLSQPLRLNVTSVQTNDVQHPPHQRPTVPSRQNPAAVQEDVQSSRQQQGVSSSTVVAADPVSSQLPDQVGRNHATQPATSQHQRPLQPRQVTPEQQRNLSLRSSPNTAVPQQQPTWQPSSTGQGVPAYTRPYHASQQTGNSLSGTISGNITAHGSSVPVVNNVASFTQTGVLLPPIPPNMLGPDPVLQEEARLKKEKENVRITHEKKRGICFLDRAERRTLSRSCFPESDLNDQAAEIRKRYAEEKEEAQRKYEALLAELKRKYEAMLDENAQICYRQSNVIHDKHVRARHSRMVAEALRNRAMFDIVYHQTRISGQQAVEVGSSSGQVQNGMDVGYAVPSNRSFAQPAQQSTVAMQQVVASGNASMASPGGGQFVNASVQAGRATLPHSSSAPARIVGTSQSNLQIPLATAVPAAFPSGGTVPQYTNGSSLVSPEGVQGQRTELVYNGTQVANNISTGQRPPVPPGISRVAVAPPISTSPAPTYAGNPSLVSGSPAPTYAGNPSLVSGSPGMGAAVGTAVQPSGLGNEIGGGLWQGRVRPGGWQNTGMNPQSGTPVPANWSRTSAGSPAVSASNPSLPSGGAAQPAADYSHGPLWTSTQNRGSGNISMPSSQPRRTWSPVWASNRTPQLAPSRMGIQSQMLHSEGRSDTSVPAAAPAPVGATNQVISSHGVPASVPVTSPECVVNMAQDLEWRSVPPSNASQQPSLSVSASGEPQVGGDERAAAGVFEFVADHSSLPGSTSRAYVPVIYLSDDD